MKVYSVFEIRTDIAENENEYEMRVVKNYKDVGLFDNIQQVKNLMNNEIDNWVEILNEDMDEDTQYFKNHNTIVKKTYDENNILYSNEIVGKCFIKEFEIQE